MLSSTLALRMAISLNYFLLLFCFSALSNTASAVNPDGKALLSLVRRWTVVPPSIRLSWRSSDFFPCSWVGVQCYQGNQLVVALALTGYGISGELGPEIAYLKHLKSIDLSMNSFSGSIPLGLGDCSFLEHLDLSVNSFTGEIPPSLGNLQNLRYINFQGNSLSSTIPESLFFIPYLHTIYLNDNHLIGTIPSNIGIARRALYLWLSGNQLTGSVPRSIGNCSTLQDLYLSGNHLTGKIPVELGKCESLIDLRIEENQLEGPIPSELGTLTKLKNLFLFANHLSGEIPISIWKIQSLENLLVHQNDLSGGVPIEVTELMWLKNLSLRDNKFRGILPQDLGVNSSLVHLDFSNNQFTGYIPPHLCFRNELRELNFGRNNFRGRISYDVGSCSNLIGLILKENNLIGEIPDLGNSSLLFMDLSCNSLSGAIPSSLGNLSNLISVNLSTNKLFGRIPPTLGRLVHLQALDLSHNSLAGELPPQLSNCSKLLQLDVSDNLLNGSIPYSFRSLTGLSTLMLSENGFTGNIPPFLFEFSKLSKLQLGGNAIGGKIPSSIGSSEEKNLRSLSLRNNRLVGHVPIEVRRLTTLEQLDISCNNLSGSLRVLNNIQQLLLLNVSHNHFSGPLPSTLLKFLNSSPTSFAGNPELFVNCFPDDESCVQNSSLTPHLLHSRNKVTHHKLDIKVLVIVAVLYFSFTFLLLQLCYMLICKEGSGDIDRCGTLLTEIMEATDNLSDRYIIQKGDIEIVYKFQLKDGSFYTLKKIPFTGSEGVYGRNAGEGEIVGTACHRNLVKQERYWTWKGNVLILYSYMENQSLHDVLHESNPLQSLRWNIRYKIAIGTAQGLSYLHHDYNPPILHGDITSMDILLDDNLEPHVSNYGLPKICQNDSSSSSFEVTDTVEYADPEIAFEKWRNRFDVYSYGVLLLELITGKKALDSTFKLDENLVKWVQSVLSGKEGIKGVVDPKLRDEFVNSVHVEHAITRVLRVALRCTLEDPFDRPSMRDVVWLLIEARSIFPNKPTPIKFYELMEATQNLNGSYIIGSGGQGTVYKVTLNLGRVYAVKKYEFVGLEGGYKSMIRELETIGKVHHPNLISFKGFWFRDKYGLILYSYMEKGSLHDALHLEEFDQPRQHIEWNIRYDIAFGIARGLSYLHFDCDPPILHRDIKSKNILLDSEFKPHISDFGLAMPLDRNASCKYSHKIDGTFGYIAPENALKAKSRESDVYAYGVVLLELITGKKAIDPSFNGEHNIVSWVQSVWTGRDEIRHVLDPRLLDRSFDSAIMKQEATSLLLLALSCTQNEWNKRPSMRDVLNQLIGILSVGDDFASHVKRE